MITAYRGRARALGLHLLQAACAWLCIDFLIGVAPGRYGAAAGWAVAFIALALARSAVRQAEVTFAALCDARSGLASGITQPPAARPWGGLEVPPGATALTVEPLYDEEHQLAGTRVCAARLPDGAPWHNPN